MSGSVADNGDEFVPLTSAGTGRLQDETEASRLGKGGSQPVEDDSLPGLDELVARIPAETREVLDELFRAKFTKVRRLPAEAFRKREPSDPGT